MPLLSEKLSEAGDVLSNLINFIIVDWSAVNASMDWVELPSP